MVIAGTDLGLVLKGNVGAWATFSPDGMLRYALGREWDEDAPTFVTCLLNPSTADHLQLDPTLRRVEAFARRERCGGFIVVNCFAYRATDPNDLITAKRKSIDICGEHNDEIITRACRGPMMAVVIAGWGCPKRELRDGIARQRSWPRRGAWKCLGKTKDGHPRHPLYLRSDAPLIQL